MNPYLPPWEYIPDGEPHIYGDRVYVYGSHDRAHGYVFCMEDYICYSAPLTDLTDWRYEGVIYKKTQDPLNRDGHMVLYAPDVTCGVDGRYYLYYVLDKAKVVSVAVCDTPAGEYQFCGYVKYADGTLLGEKEGDEPQFDPGVLTEGDKVYLYTGLGIIGDKSRLGAMATVLLPDMLTIAEAPVYIAPSGVTGAGTTFKGHEFFEAPSMRKVGDMYYLIYSSIHMTELCYATSKYPTRDFVYGGVIVSNCDLGIATYKPAEKRTYPYGNNHGSIIQIANQWYIFYHRMTNDTWFSRQACIEQIEIASDGKIAQVEMTSQGARGKPFLAAGKHPAYTVCNLWNDVQNSPVAIGVSGSSVLPAKPAKVTQEGFNESYDSCYISDITNGTTMGFKHYDCKGIKKITLTTRAYGRGDFEIRMDSPDNKPLGTVSIVSANIWTDFSGYVTIPDGIHALYLTYKGGGTPSLLSFTLS
ncbi:MAG: family 43 glycosylhydrolase [Defluviitaleaceae bacterium]|nr:family 43 glycosylhydrolase [Defluviitaleaceae bacterium]